MPQFFINGFVETKVPHVYSLVICLFTLDYYSNS